MEFFYDQFLKLKNNYFLILLIILLVLINDYFILKFNNNVSKNLVTAENTIPVSNIISEEANNVNVDIKGYVKKSGVYNIPSNYTVNDAIKMAGGLKKNASTDSINLAKNVYDEMVIIVPKKESSSVTKPSSETTNNSDVINNIVNDALVENINYDNNNSSNKVKLININEASREELMYLTGIGESKADEIINYRKTKAFENISDIMNVSGIGESLYEKIKDSISV